MISAVDSLSDSDLIWISFHRINPGDTRRRFNVYKTSIRIDVVYTLKRRRVSTGKKLSSEAVLLTSCFQKCGKTHRKYQVWWSSFLVKLQASDCNFAQKELYGRYFTVSLAKTEQVLLSNHIFFMWITFVSSLSRKYFDPKSFSSYYATTKY